MHTMKLENCTNKDFVLSVEPNPAQYKILPGDIVRVLGDFERDEEGDMLVAIHDDATVLTVVVYSAGDVEVRKDGQRLQPAI